MVSCFYSYLVFIEIPVLNANSVEPDQTPQSAASDLGLDCCKFPFYGTLGLNELVAFDVKKNEKNKLSGEVSIFILFDSF